MESVGIIFDEYLCSMDTYTPEFMVCVYCNFNYSLWDICRMFANTAMRLIASFEAML